KIQKLEIAEPDNAVGERFPPRRRIVEGDQRTLEGEVADPQRAGSNQAPARAGAADAEGADRGIRSRVVPQSAPPHRAWPEPELARHAGIEQQAASLAVEEGIDEHIGRAGPASRDMLDRGGQLAKAFPRAAPVGIEAPFAAAEIQI